MPLRILLVNDHWLPFVTAGAEVSVANLAEALASAGHETHVLARYPLDALPPRTGTFKLHTLPYHIPATPWRELSQEFNQSPKSMRAAIMQLEKTHGRFDVVHANNGVSSLALMPEGTRITKALRAVTVRSHVHVCPLGNGACLDEGGLRQCRTTFECARRKHPGGVADLLRTGFALATYGRYHHALRRAVQEADLVLADSEYVSMSLAANGLRRNAPVVYEAVDAVPPETPRATPTGAPRILFVGRLTSEKGPHLLLEAFGKAQASAARSATLVFVGNGPLRGSLEARARSLQVTVEFLGSLSRNAMLDQYARASLVVVPSLWQEPFGMVAAEAVILGSPVITARAGGLPEAAGQEMDLTSSFPIGDVAALERLLTERILRPVPSVGDVRVRRVLSRVSPTEVARRHVEEYERCIATLSRRV